MSENNTKKFNIQIAAQMSGLSTHTIRAWEKRYQALTPARNDNGRRLYGPEEIDRLIMLSQLTQMGTSIGQIAGLTDPELKEAYDKLLKTSGQKASGMMMKKSLNLQETKNKLLNAVGNYQVDLISQLLSEAKIALDPKVFALDILDPLIQEVKRRKDTGKFQDAQAQALFAIAKFHAGNIIYAHFEKGLKSSSRIVLTSVEKEHHSFPLLISALLCCHHKKHFYYLNSNLPGPSIIDAVKATEATVLVLSLPSNAHEGSETTALLDEVINTLSPKVKVWLLGDHGLNLSRWKNVKKITTHKELDEALSANS
jgi:MerR family transcriptional regulator, light-induced transcriptional regulator